MGKIFCLMGKSACGKDTIYKQILSEENLPLKTLIPYTTRPIRDGERNGVEYYFLTDEEQQALERQEKLLSCVPITRYMGYGNILRPMIISLTWQIMIT